MLAAAEAVAAGGGASHSTAYRRRLAFVAVAGDTWGAMGSRRLLWELHSGTAAIEGIRFSDIDQVLESRLIQC